MRPRRNVRVLRGVTRARGPSLVVNASVKNVCARLLGNCSHVLMGPTFGVNSAVDDVANGRRFRGPEGSKIGRLVIGGNLVGRCHSFARQYFRSVAPRRRRHMCNLFNSRSPLIRAFSLFRRRCPRTVRFRNRRELVSGITFRCLYPMVQ